MDNPLLEKLQKKAQPVGTFFSMGNAAVAECLALSGIDYMIIDMEHGPFGIESSAEIMRGAELHGTAALARVKDSSRTSVLKALDIGARGLVVPNIHTVDEVKKLVEYGKYYPLGQRGMATTRSAGYGFADYALNLAEYMQSSNKNTLLLPQCETKGCLENIEEITAIDGIAGIFVGPFDLSVALNKPIQFTDPEFIEAIQRILNACKNAGKFCFTFATNVDGVRNSFNQGFDSVVMGMDSSVYVQAFKNMLSQIRA